MGRWPRASVQENQDHPNQTLYLTRPAARLSEAWSSLARAGQVSGVDPPNTSPFGGSYVGIKPAGE